MFTARYALSPPYVTQIRFIVKGFPFLPKLDGVKSISPSLGRTAVCQLVAQWLYRLLHGVGFTAAPRDISLLRYDQNPFGAHLTSYSTGS